MRINSEQLKTTLTKQLDSIYLVFGVELLIVEQSLSYIRDVAKTQGFAERVSFEIDSNFDWNKIISEFLTNSLFSPKRIIECRLKTGKIGIKGSKTLSEIVANIPSDTLLIVSTGKLEMSQQKSRWFKAFEANGSVVQVWEVQRQHLVGWITNHMTELGLAANTKVAQSIAYYTEGNLLASMQEIQKLKMAYPNGNIDVKDYTQQLSEQSQYNIYNLINSALIADSEQMLKIYTTMINDTATPIMLINALHRELNAMINMAIELQQTKKIAHVLQSHKVWKSRQAIISNALKRLSYQRLQKIVLLLGRIDRSIKGMDNLNVIDECRILLLTIAGKSPWNQ